MARLKASDFVIAHTITNCIYTTGLFYTGITIYNQQIRTLNLIYHLIEENVIKKPGIHKKPVVVIGGGVSGVMAAIALKKLNYNVIIIEEKSLLLHLQHGCSTRIIHPYLPLWPQIDAFKPFTELPFGNWISSDASTVEKSLIKEFELNKSAGGGSLYDYYDVSKIRVDAKSKKIIFCSNKVEISHKYSHIILATGFGLEKYVGKKEKTKSYWRNDDLSQLRLADQVRKFFITGAGDGGVSDVCRLALLAFDPVEWAQKFNKLNKLVVGLRKIHKAINSSSNGGYFDAFEVLFKRHKKQIEKIIKEYKRTDIEEIILNGHAIEFKDILTKRNLSFINAWMIFILYKLSIVTYKSGEFPKEFGEYIFIDDHYYLIIRHGTEKDKNYLQTMFNVNSSVIDNIQRKQSSKKYNDFSTKPQWSLNFWNEQSSNNYIAQKYMLSQKLSDFFTIYLATLNGIVSNYIQDKIGLSKIGYRLTAHRLVHYSGKYFFQQLSDYVGTRTNNNSKSNIGRTFPIDKGLVGIAMRTNYGFSLVTNTKRGEYFKYDEIFARRLSKDIKSFLVVPIPTKNKVISTLCLYIDTDEKILVENEDFRKIVYWSLLDVVNKIDLMNVSEFSIDTPIVGEAGMKRQLKKLLNMEGVRDYMSEINAYRRKGKLVMSSNKLIDIYDK